jgi:hypothetical protein
MELTTACILRLVSAPRQFEGQEKNGYRAGGPASGTP